MEFSVNALWARSAVGERDEHFLTFIHSNRCHIAIRNNLTGSIINMYNSNASAPKTKVIMLNWSAADRRSECKCDIERLTINDVWRFYPKAGDQRLQVTGQEATATCVVHQRWNLCRFQILCHYFYWDIYGLYDCFSSVLFLKYCSCPNFLFFFSTSVFQVECAHKNLKTTLLSRTLRAFLQGRHASRWRVTFVALEMWTQKLGFPEDRAGTRKRGQLLSMSSRLRDEFSEAKKLERPQSRPHAAVHTSINLRATLWSPSNASSHLKTSACL